MSAEPGILESLYIGGVNLARNPDSVTPGWELAVQDQRAKDASLLSHSAAPYPGCSLTIAKHTLSFGWKTMAPADIALVNGLISWRGPIYVCIWSQITEAFPTLASGVLARRTGLDAVPSLYWPTGAVTRFATTGRDANGVSLAVALGTPNLKRRTPWAATGGATAPSLIDYYPAFFMKVSDGQTSFSMPFQQGQTLKMIEV